MLAKLTQYGNRRRLLNSRYDDQTLNTFRENVGTIDSQGVRIRRTAFKALGGMGDATTIDSLIMALKDNNES
ncbi:MAG: hypothetical protein HQK54_04110, partial [Oligoflexales bacterium]|nr:hypothetical protein [Oligoflexales bacterium]